MNIISSMHIAGLFGRSKTIDIQFDDKFNFFIGQNGTGKTTIINLLAATLLSDFGKLDKTPFSRIEVKLKEVGGRKRPSIIVEKIQKKGLPFFDISYTLRLSSKEEYTYDLDAYEEEANFRGLPNRMIHERMFNKRRLDIREILASIVNTRWLSVHRSNDDSRRTEERKYSSSVDQKLFDLNNELVRFFSKASKLYAEHTAEFQKSSFLALLNNKAEGELFKFTDKLDISEQKRSLEKIFETLGVEPKHYSVLLESHADALSVAKNRKEGSGVSIKLLGSMYNAWRANSLILDYKKLEAKRDEIFRLRDNFIALLNKMFNPRKTVEITSRNELLFRTTDGFPVDPQELSSGEKQLLIILGEALILELKPVVYIADEPELSLHVNWQEQLTDAISFLNPSAQIVFATHSPDIVNIHLNKVIDMEDIYQ
jgi:energy-coupling factor transporter ATP-binding protein EcfA2